MGAFLKAYADAMRHYFDFSGRTTRSQYWLFILVACCIALLGLAFDALAGLRLPRSDYGPITALLLLVHLIPSWAALARRTHDSDNSAWWVVGTVIPLVNLIVVLVFGCLPSSPGTNRYGPLPDRGPAPRNPTQPTGVAQPSPAGRPTPKPETNINIVEQLERLNSLRSAGAIDDEEFQQMKSDLMARR